MDYIIKASYGNDSVALIQWCYENGVENAVVLYNDTGWAAPGWEERLAQKERWARALGFATWRTSSVGMKQLVQDRKGWPRQGMQFCTAELKMKPTEAFI